MMKKIDERVDRINKVKCTLLDFILRQPKLQPEEEFDQLLNSCFKLNLHYEQITEIAKFLQKFKQEVVPLEHFQVIQTAPLLELTDKVLEYSICREPLFSKLQEDLQIRM